jgi:hypothetical protein
MRSNAVGEISAHTGFRHRWLSQRCEPRPAIGTTPVCFRVCEINGCHGNHLLNDRQVTEGNVTIGYNRRKGGADVLVPLDLSVVDSEYTADQRVIRKH